MTSFTIVVTIVTITIDFLFINIIVYNTINAHYCYS